MGDPNEARLARVAAIVAGIIAGAPGAAPEPTVARAIEIDEEIVRQLDEDEE